jgi:hypothetical protein
VREVGWIDLEEVLEACIISSPKWHLLVVEPDYIPNLEVMFQPHLDPIPWWGFVLYSFHDYPHTFFLLSSVVGGSQGGKPQEKKLGKTFYMYFGWFWHTVF